jgi:type IV pilus assembly protein PilX
MFARSVRQFKHRNANRQQGVVLIVALIMLIVISLTATLAVRNATSNEASSNNVRTTNLAMQAAEVALDYCEQSVIQFTGGTVTIAITSTPTLYDFASPPKWQSITNWDTATTAAFEIPAVSVNAAGISTTFSRFPECIVERSPITAETDSGFVITARGFGPDVAAPDANRTRPRGSEVWLQSTLRLKN